MPSRSSRNDDLSWEGSGSFFSASLTSSLLALKCMVVRKLEDVSKKGNVVQVMAYPCRILLLFSTAVVVSCLCDVGRNVTYFKTKRSGQNTFNANKIAARLVRCSKSRQIANICSTCKIDSPDVVHRALHSLGLVYVNDKVSDVETRIVRLYKSLFQILQSKSFTSRNVGSESSTILLATKFLRHVYFGNIEGIFRTYLEILRFLGI